MPERITDHTDLIHELSVAGRRAAAAGLVLGSGGNLSARLPGAASCVATAGGTWLEALTPADFSVVDLRGQRLDGNPVPSSEVGLHLEIYRARPDVTAVIHLHPQHAVLLDALELPIRLLTTDHVFYVRRTARVAWLPSGTRALAEAAAAALSDGTNCLLLAHHGCAVVADSVELALKRAMNLEEAATATYRALLLGDRDTACPPEHFAALERDRDG